MHPSYAYTPQIWAPLLTIVVLIALGAYAWRHRDVPGALPFSFGCLITVFWAFGTVMEYAAVGDSERIAWLKGQAVTQLPSVTAIALFILEYVWPGRWLTRRNLVLLSIAPLVLIAMVLTDPVYHLMWRGFYVNGEVLPVRAPLAWALVAYAYLIGLAEMFAFLWLFVRSPRHRWPVAIMLVGFIAARVLYLADQRLDLYAIIIPLVTYAIALFAFRILDANVLAREAAIGGMRDGMLVLDPARHVASLNSAAEAILGMVEQDVRGRAVDTLLSGHPALAAVISAADGGAAGAADAGAAETGAAEVSLGTGSDARHFQLAYTRLRDFRGLHTGDLVLLHDVTEQRSAQQRLLEQERALASLREREQLARDLHDGIGQVLGYAGLQTDSANTLLDQGQNAEAHLVLERLAGVLREAHADVRQQILDLRASPSQQAPFCDVVRSYLQGYTANYGIAAEFNPCHDLDDDALPADASAELLRILQEALSNVRRHSGARRVRVSLEGSQDALQMTVADDGHGFDLAELSEPRYGHLGLGTMRERATAIGGQMTVDSGPQGTTVRVTMPIRRDDDARASG